MSSSVCSKDTKIHTIPSSTLISNTWISAALIFCLPMATAFFSSLKNRFSYSKTCLDPFQLSKSVWKVVSPLRISTCPGRPDEIFFSSPVPIRKTSVVLTPGCVSLVSVRSGVDVLTVFPVGNTGGNYKCNIADRWGFDIGIVSHIIMLDINGNEGELWRQSSLRSPVKR